MNIVLCDSMGNSATMAADQELLSRLGTNLIKSPIVIDGMGDKVLMCSCKFCKGEEFTNVAEIIILEYEIEGGNRVSKSFQGYDSYALQIGIHELTLS